MATEVTLPALGESVTEGTVTRWLKQVGDTVAVDEALLEVSTDKVDTEIPSPVAGTLLEIKANEDETVEVGAVLAVIGDQAESGDGGGDAGGGAEDEGDTQAEADAESGQQAEAQEQPAAEQQEPAPEPAQAEEPKEEPAEQPAERSAEQPAEEPKEEQPAGGSSGGSGATTSVTLPALGESVTEGTVTRWLKQVGDAVAVDEALLEVSTDKVDTEIPSPVAGTLLEIKVAEDETVEVGAELAVIGEEGAAPQGGGDDKSDDQSGDKAEQQGPPAEEPKDEPAEEETDVSEAEQGESAPTTGPAEKEMPEQPAAQEAAPAAPAPAAPAPAAPAPADSGRDEPSGYVTPLVRKMAAQHGVDLAAVTGTGVGGRIRKQDVLDAAQKQGTTAAPPTAAAQAAAAPAAPAAPAAAAPAAPAATASTAPSSVRGTTEPMTRLRKVIAKRMLESLQNSAQLTTVVEVDVTAVSRLRDAAKGEFASREGVKLSYMPFFAKATVDALKRHPKLNAAIDTEKGEVTYYDRENIAIAVDTEKGLLTPVIKDAGDLSIAGLARKIADVAERTRTNKITPDELSGGTFTLTNTGSRGALFDTPIINQPQVAILGTGSVVKRAVVIDDPNLGETIAVRQMVYLALTYDHRLVDGADAARFLSDVKARLETGAFEV